MYLTSADLQAIDRARYQLSALQVEVQLLRLELIHKANFNPNQPRVPRGHAYGGHWTRVGGRPGAESTPPRVVTDTGVSEPPPRRGIETTTLPGNRQIVRDRSGNEPWEAYVNALRPDGSVSERVVVNRDGSAIRSQFSTTPELTGWDESHTIIGAGGETLTCQTLGKTQTIFDATGEVIQVASWTTNGPAIEILRPDPGFGRPSVTENLGLGGVAILGLAAVLFSWFASTTQPNRAAVFALRARDYRKQGEQTVVEPLFVGELNEPEVKAACKAIKVVQALTDDAARKAITDGPYSSPDVYGTAVHTLLKGEIGRLNNPNLAAEVSYLKSQEADHDADYGELGSIRIDVFDNTAKDGTVCVYDIKTGERGLSGPRAAEIAKAVLRRWPKTKRIIVIEVRPTVERPHFKGIRLVPAFVVPVSAEYY